MLDSTEIPPFGRDFPPTGYVRPVEAFSAPAWRCANADEISQRLTPALTLQLLGDRPADRRFG